MTRRRAVRILRAALALVPLALLFASAVPARALTQGPYTLEVLVDGRPLTELNGNGRSYVEASAGREYALRLTNNTERRVAMAVTVDGLNAVDAKTTTARAASKWILGPYESIVLEGWQTSAELSRHFYFTSERASYGAWLGKTANLGVIAAAVFRERTHESRGQMLLTEPSSPAIPEAGADADGPRGRQYGAVAPPSPAAPGAAESGRGSVRGGILREPKQLDIPLSDEYAATGIGREVDHRVQRVPFDAERSAAALLEIRYEYRPALVKLGLLPRECPRDPLGRRERARGFERGFSPDPYRSGGCGD
jgi:hypothetical protein